MIVFDSLVGEFRYGYRIAIEVDEGKRNEEKHEQQVEQPSQPVFQGKPAQPVGKFYWNLFHPGDRKKDEHSEEIKKKMSDGDADGDV